MSLLAALPLQRRRSKGEQGSRNLPRPAEQKFIGGQSPPPPYFGSENTFTDLFDNSCDIGDFRVHIFYPQTTQGLPKKHHQAGPRVQLSTDVLSQIDYGHTRHCEDWKEVCLCQLKTPLVFWKIWVGVCAWLSGRWALHVSKRSAGSPHHKLRRTVNSSVSNFKDVVRKPAIRDLYFSRRQNTFTKARERFDVVDI